MLPFHRRLITVVEYIAAVPAVIAAPARVEYDAPVGVYRHAPGMSLEASSDLSCKLGRHAVLRDVVACALTLPACTVQTCGNPLDVQSSTRVEETAGYGVVVCARSYTDGTFTGSSTPVVPALAVYWRQHHWTGISLQRQP